MIRFNIPYLVGTELGYIQDALTRGRLAGDGEYTRRCTEMLRVYLGGQPGVLLTHSCTAALEMAAILIDIKPGDEVIMPSYTFVSTANAFVLRGGIPVFVDIRPDTLNIDESLIEQAITSRTKAIVAVHYAGVSCEMDSIMDIALRYGLRVIEDAAQGIGSSYRGSKLGTIGHLAALSFHETKNVVSGEGGALIVNDSTLMERAEIIREKGTNRSRFLRGSVDKYTWVDIGSSYLPSEIIAAFLYAQLRNIDRINALRMGIWTRYRSEFQNLEQQELISFTAIPDNCIHNAHLFCLLLKSHDQQRGLLSHLDAEGVRAVFHYVPLHSSDAGIRFGRVGSVMHNTNELSNLLVRLPIYPDLTSNEVEKVIASTRQFLM